MTIFIILALIMTVLAVLIIVIPFRRKKLDFQKISLEQDENIAILRNQLSQFELDFKEGRISQEQLAESRLDIEKRLLQEELAIAADQFTSENPKQGSRGSGQLFGLQPAYLYVPSCFISWLAHHLPSICQKQTKCNRSLANRILREW